ncbi:hypothetical protein ALT785_390146 [Alteromonas infernus]
MTLVVVLIASRSVSVHWAKSKPDIEFEKSAYTALFYCLSLFAG